MYIVILIDIYLINIFLKCTVSNPDITYTSSTDSTTHNNAIDARLESTSKNCFIIAEIFIF